jgi:hypothetical protein
MQELRVFRDAPIVSLASYDIRIQIIDRFHVRRHEACDRRETLDLLFGQSNVFSEANHFPR